MDRVWLQMRLLITDQMRLHSTEIFEILSPMPLTFHDRSNKPLIVLCDIASTVGKT